MLCRPHIDRIFESKDPVGELRVELDTERDDEVSWYTFTITARKLSGRPIKVRYSESDEGDDEGKDAALKTLSAFYGVALYTGDLRASSGGIPIAPGTPDRYFSLGTDGDFNVLADGEVVEVKAPMPPVPTKEDLAKLLNELGGTVGYAAKGWNWSRLEPGEYGWSGSYVNYFLNMRLAYEELVDGTTTWELYAGSQSNGRRGRDQGAEFRGTLPEVISRVKAVMQAIPEPRYPVTDKAQNEWSGERVNAICRKLLK